MSTMYTQIGRSSFQPRQTTSWSDFKSSGIESLPYLIGAWLLYLGYVPGSVVKFSRFSSFYVFFHMFLFDKRPCLQLEALVRSVICSWRGDFTKSLHKFFKLMAWPTSGHLERDWWWGCLWSPDICDLPYADIPTGRALSPTLWWWGISNLPWRVAYLRQNNSEQVS